MMVNDTLSRHDSQGWTCESKLLLLCRFIDEELPEEQRKAFEKFVEREVQEQTIEYLTMLADNNGVSVNDFCAIVDIDPDRLNNGGLCEAIELAIQDGEDPDWIIEQLNMDAMHNALDESEQQRRDEKRGLYPDLEDPAN